MRRTLLGFAPLLVLALACAHGHHRGGHGRIRGEGPVCEHHADVERLVAIEKISQLKARYQRCIDTRDLACLRDQVFAEGAELHFHGGDYDIRVKGWPEIEAFYRSAFTPEKFGMHHVHHPEIAVDGDSATGTWYLQDVFIDLEENTTLRGSALYSDRYVKVGDDWRIASSTYRRLWEEVEPRGKDVKLLVKPIHEGR
jgi:hypothetical protein